MMVLLHVHERMILKKKHMKAIFTLQHMHTHNLLANENAHVGQRNARQMLQLKQCCHCGIL